MPPSGHLSGANYGFEESLSDLRLLLHDEAWQTADQLTADLLHQALALPSPPETAGGMARTGRPLLTTATLATLPCALLHAIDDCWTGASGGHFGFSAQGQIYAQSLEAIAFDPALYNWSTPHPFFAEVGWLMLFPLRPVGFLRFYRGLEFDLDAPRGHLPALWYWQVPWLYSLRLGGFLSGQGAGFGDLSRLDAMMERLSRCSQLP